MTIFTYRFSASTEIVCEYSFPPEVIRLRLTWVGRPHYWSSGTRIPAGAGLCVGALLVVLKVPPAPLLQGDA